ncbi:IQ motif EF-hand binding site [Neofusicoccum parvum]|uniref:HECT-type E3 ubiquitin transferase n=1 Tax=Botryosphaeria parva (strain UCR-NP2) TaxID=1287680 RepID=R1EUB0_BOTPV|nr:putative iq and hect domain protein [Neofusicoccum parvum UCRNP2]GME47205.1 IQ motif EF-hand binding site [Neofusicoccum parvum]
MPFFIPFTTRVQIFREFVRLDQMKRRHGRIDPDQWRMAMMHDLASREPIERHHAKVRRKHEFDDAFEQFFKLGEALKEPIQITFVDQFDTVEAGIDGGGVTKEFLTSVSSQAFAPSENGIDLFVENEAHLLYPNPSAVEHQKEILREAGVRENSKLWKDTVQELLERYEFLGRIVGKCLYEGILVDINFAPFFLLKWALTGGTNSAAKESGYRANLNDLRDLDEDLYQGLLTLKNYPGNVEEDFSLNFTITDVIRTDTSTGQQITRTKDLVSDGSNMPVTNENRLVYISYVARHRLQVQPAPQTAAFLRGLSTMISPSWLSMFNQSESQTLIGGTSSSIDVADLRAHTQYGGLYVIGDDRLEHPSVQLFWRVMESLSDDERRAVLKFVTSTPRAPLLGFSSLNPRFSIRDAGHDVTRLPSTSTCVNLLKLPLYKDERTLREKLLYAVNSGAGFDLS